MTAFCPVDMYKNPFVVGVNDKRTYVLFQCEDSILYGRFQAVKSGEKGTVFCRKRQSGELIADSS